MSEVGHKVHIVGHAIKGIKHNAKKNGAGPTAGAAAVGALGAVTAVGVAAGAAVLVPAVVVGAGIGLALRAIFRRVK